MHKKMNCGFITEFLSMLSSAFSADFLLLTLEKLKKFERKWKR